MLKRVYIIDDEKDFCHLLKSYLLKKNYEVEVSNLLLDGLKAIENNPYGIVFMDNNLPDGLGWETIGELHDKYPDLKIHLLSGYHYTNTAINRGNQIKVWQKPLNFSGLGINISNNDTCAICGKYSYFFAGTFAPSFLASERPIAMACLRLVTFFPLRPLFNVPCFFSCITFSTLSPAFLEYFAIIIFLFTCIL